jgi:hypothetical protein
MKHDSEFVFSLDGSKRSPAQGLIRLAVVFQTDFADIAG